ncbi:hypothetical protein [Priestia megaterium]|uniref:hypothetical protein n=1 Tax=Priestia megaterium TaxID=1404 RepID=UPI001884ABEB|nr:hypothetical protein [Priestia megaterium]
MIGGQGEDSCWESGTDETPQTRRLSDRPRKSKPCKEINSGVISGSAHLFHWFIFRLDSCSYVPASFYSRFIYHVVVVVATAEVLAITASIAACWA